MDEQKAHASELEIDTTGDEAADTDATDTTEQDIDSEGEQKPDTLELSTEQKSKANVVREQQARKWADKIQSGEKTLSDLPPNMKWLVPDIESLLGTKPENLTLTVKEVIAQERAFEKEKELIAYVNEALPKSKRLEVKEKRDKFLAKGLSTLDALEAAMESLNLDPAEDRLDARRQAARLRTPGRYKAAGKETTPDAIHKEGGYAEVAKNIPEAQRLEYLRSLRGLNPTRR